MATCEGGGEVLLGGQSAELGRIGRWQGGKYLGKGYEDSVESDEL